MDNMKILIVDDEKYIRETLKIILSDAGYAVMTAQDGKTSIEIMKNEPVDILLADYKMPGMNGVVLMQEAKKINDEIETIIMSAYSEIKPVVTALKLGAFDYIEKNFSNDELCFVIEKALERKRLKQKNAMLCEKIKQDNCYGDFIVSDEKMQQIVYVVKRIANTKASILITGESGTGKDEIAKLVHRLGKNSNSPFVAINCAAIPENLMEAELFGVDKGAFTGAEFKKGKFELAENGTLFLDEIGEMPLQLQSKLLRAIQEHEICHVGGNQNIKVNVRIVAATNADIEENIKNGKFREDLFYRLNVVNIPVPPLRERKKDIMALTDKFIAMFAREYNKKVETVSFAVLDEFMNCKWPGNVRELKNVIERTVLMIDPEKEIIGKEDLEYLKFDKCNERADLTLSLRDYEKIIIENALKRNHNNKSRTAEELDINRRTLYNKLRELGIEE